MLVLWLQGDSQEPDLRGQELERARRARGHMFGPSDRKESVFNLETIFSGPGGRKPAGARAVIFYAHSAIVGP